MRITDAQRQAILNAVQGVDAQADDPFFRLAIETGVRLNATD
jgi:hypothetical protein